MSKLLYSVKNIIKSLIIRIQGIGIEKNIKRNIRRIKTKASNPKTIVFISQFPEMWNSFKTVYEKMAKDPDFTVIVLAVPKKESKNCFSNENEAYNFLNSEGIKAVNAFQDGHFLDLRTLGPDYIFIQRPYDDMVPKEYSLWNLSKNGLICYIPYYASMSYGVHQNYQFDVLYRFFYIVFSDCDENVAYLEDKISNNTYRRYQIIKNIGYPRFELLNQVSENNKEIHNILWTPRWSVKDDNNRSYFYDYLEFLVDYVQNNSDLFLTIRPHPLMFRTFIETGFRSQNEIDELIERIDKIKNIEFDKNKDYLCSFEKSDLLISDATSLLVEYFYTGKPVIIFDNERNLFEFAQKQEDTFYYAHNVIELKKYLEDLVDAGMDVKRDQRNELIKEQLKMARQSSTNIIATIKEL